MTSTGKQSTTRRKVVAFVQARMGSSRLPGKMMLPLNGRPVIDWVLTRLAMVNGIDKIVVLTSVNPKDDDICAKAVSLGVEVIRGHEFDVLSRFIIAAEEFPAHIYLRVCADNPFICPQEIARLIDFHSTNDCDYSFNHTPKGKSKYADGFGAEAIGFSAFSRLSEAYPTATPDQREHVTLYFWDNEQNFSICAVPAPPQLSYPDMSFDIDTIEDYRLMELVASQITIGTFAPGIIEKCRTRQE